MLVFFFLFISFFLLIFFYKLSWLHIIFYISIFSFIWYFMLYVSFTSYIFLTNNFFLDILSSRLILLTLWISNIIYMCRYKVEKFSFNNNFFGYLIYFLMFVLFVTFVSHNYFFFYIMFEVSLIPTLILIMGWGYQPERLQAGVYLIIYTICASIPLLAGLFYQGLYGGTLFIFFAINSCLVNIKFMGVFWIVFLFAFMVKIPIYLTHLWLPKAHVEAPVSGSIILAGVLLKLGGYGLLRISNLIFWGNSYIMSIFISISIWGAFITRLICVRQVDLKSLIAYSSVGHIGLVIRGFICNQMWGWFGSLRIIISHGLVSSGLFSLANITYENTSTRSIYLTKGLICVLPSLSIFWFLLSVINIGAPPSINLLREIILLTSILNSSISLSFLIGFSSFLAAGYSLYLFTSTQHGQVSIYINTFVSCNYRILSSLLFHMIPVFILIICSEFITIWV